MDYSNESLRRHRELKGKMSIVSTFPLETLEDLSIAYTPGVSEPCRVIAKHPEEVWNLTIKSHTVAVITDGSSVLGLGNIGPEAGLPVMEGKCILYKKFTGLDAFPLCLKVSSVDEFVQTVKCLQPTFGAIHIEDVKAPECYEIIERLEKELSIPVMQDDQYGTAVVTLAALINALMVADKNIADVKVVINGAGAAGLSIADLLLDAGVQHVKVVDSQGVICDTEETNIYKRAIARRTNKTSERGSLKDVLRGSDVFIGVSKGNIVTAEDISTMNAKSIVMAMANPTPEIMPDEAKKGGAYIVATGRSDFPNQVNNVLAYPGLFLGVLEARLPKFTKQMYLSAAYALAGMIQNPTPDRILPSLFEANSARVIADAVKLIGST